MSEVRHDAQANLVPHFTPGGAWQSEQLLVVDRGEGCYVYDSHGTDYLDGLSGLFCSNLGHGRQDLVAAASAQMSKLAFYPNWGYAHEPAAEAARRIAERTPGDLSETFFVSSGSEAAESALKFARNYHVSRGEASRYKVIARSWAYHGTTLGALAMTGVPKVRDMYAPNLWDGVRHVPNTYGQHPGPDGDPYSMECVQAIIDTIEAEDPETIAMLIAEPVQNGRGAVVPPPGYWKALREICDKYGILLCADEVICAYGRLGYWFGSIYNEVVPDMITFAKGITSAYVPLGGVIVRRPLVEQVWEGSGSFNHGSTFGGHPVATAVACATLDAMSAEGTVEHVLATAPHLQDGLNKLVDAHPSVMEARGMGYFYALELMADRPSGRLLSSEQSATLMGGELMRYLREARVLIRPDDRGATMLIVAPPLVADPVVLDDLLMRLDQVLNRVDAFVKN